MTKIQKAITNNTGSVLVLGTTGTTIATLEILEVQICEGSKIIKYLDSNGEYRLFAFNKFYKSNYTPKEIGQIENIVYNIESAQGAFRSLGFTNSEVLTLINESVPVDWLIDYKLIDMYTSPRVYLYIGDNSTFEDKDWLLVKQKSKDNLVKPHKANFVKIELTVEYELNTLTTM